MRSLAKMMLCTFILSGCGKEGAAGGSNPQPAPGDCDHWSQPTWENFGEDFVRNYCKGCHSGELEAADRTGAPVGIDFASHDDVLNQMDRFTARASGDNPTMPPGGGPTADELSQLERWLACEAP